MASLHKALDRTVRTWLDWRVGGVRHTTASCTGPSWTAAFDVREGGFMTQSTALATRAPGATEESYLLAVARHDEDDAWLTEFGRHGWLVRFARNLAEAISMTVHEPPAAICWQAPNAPAQVSQLAQTVRSRTGLRIPVLKLEGQLGDDPSIVDVVLDHVNGQTVQQHAGNPALPQHVFLRAVHHWRSDQHNGRQPGALVRMDFFERPELVQQLGPVVRYELRTALLTAARTNASQLEIRGWSADGALLVLLRVRSQDWIDRRIKQINDALAAARIRAAPQRPLTPVIGVVRLTPTTSEAMALRRAAEVCDHAASRLDLVPQYATISGRGDAAHPVRRILGRLRQGSTRDLACAALSVLLGAVLPFGLLLVAHRFGVALAVWTHLAVAKPPEPRQQPRRRTSTAVIAAYLPNEHETILETVRAFLACEPDGLQVIVAYNTPVELPVEETLRIMAERDPRLLAVKVKHSTSKAQNVNAVIALAEGEVIGIFDADHQPMPGAFRRAGLWIDAGYDVVQGRCVVRNGQEGLVQRTVAVEFDSIYGVSHPGRAALHGFGIFGGSNGYWRADLLHRVRMQGAMLTEDIDSSIRCLLAGAHLAYDPGIVSRELAPATWSALWRQRLRWAQGWFQVTRRHGWRFVDNPTLSLQQRFGLAFLLRWREVQPWIVQLVLPLMVFWLWQNNWSLSEVTDTNLLLLATTLVLSTAPGQTLFAWLRAGPTTRKHPWWFIGYLFVGALFYGEWRNLVARTAHLRELLGVSEWAITPRR